MANGRNGFGWRMKDWAEEERIRRRRHELAMFDDFCKRQRQRLARDTTPPKPMDDPGGAYTLTIRGAKPAQIALRDTPEELLKREGQVGYSKSSLTQIAGN